MYLEIQKSSDIPAPDNYNQDDKFIRPSRFQGVGLGYDKKYILKEIKKAPGPGDYNVEELTSMSMKSKIKNSSFNFLQNLVKKNISAQRNKHFAFQTQMPERKKLKLQNYYPDSDSEVENARRSLENTHRRTDKTELYGPADNLVNLVTPSMHK